MKRKLSFELKDTLLSCTFSGERCDFNNFEWYFDLFYGNCYRFNANKSSIKSLSQLGIWPPFRAFCWQS